MLDPLGTGATAAGPPTMLTDAHHVLARADRQPLVRQARDAQDGRHCAPARRQDGTGEQHDGMTPAALKEQRRKR